MYSHYLMSFVLWISIRFPPLLSQSSALFHDQCCPVWSMKKEEEPRGTLGGGGGVLYSCPLLCSAKPRPSSNHSGQHFSPLPLSPIPALSWNGLFARTHQDWLFSPKPKILIFDDFSRKCLYRISAKFLQFFFLPHHPFFNQRVICTRKLYK